MFANGVPAQRRENVIADVRTGERARVIYGFGYGVRTCTDEMVPRHSTSSQFSDRNVSQANIILGPYEHLEKIPTHIEGMI